MDARGIEQVLDESERLLRTGAAIDLRTLGFWRAVAATKREPKYLSRYADRIGAIDTAAFRRRVPLRFPAAVGVTLMTLGTLFGLVVLWLAAAFQPPAREIAVLVGMGALLVCTHGLAHVVVGRAAGMRFTDWFADVPRRPQPGFKVDYATYLRAPARARAWMHASGAIVTKLVPFIVALYAASVRADAWVIALLVVVGVVQIATDALWSVRASDWKKFRREMKLAR
jgi:hypothetical protein